MPKPPSIGVVYTSKKLVAVLKFSEITDCAMIFTKLVCMNPVHDGVILGGSCVYTPRFFRRFKIVCIGDLVARGGWGPDFDRVPRYWNKILPLCYSPGAHSAHSAHSALRPDPSFFPYIYTFPKKIPGKILETFANSIYGYIIYV